jgi:hypothetical protein
MEKLIYDVDGKQGSKVGDNCPKFVVDEQKQTVSLIDRAGNKANMTVSEFNQIARAFKSGEIKELASVIRK